MEESTAEEYFVERIGILEKFECGASLNEFVVITVKVSFLNCFKVLVELVAEYYTRLG